MCTIRFPAADRRATSMLPRSLTDEFEHVIRAWGKIWHRIITADETPLPHFLPETKRQCMYWFGPGESKPVNAPSIRKFQMTVFRDFKGILHTDYCRSKHTINT